MASSNIPYKSLKNLEHDRHQLVDIEDEKESPDTPPKTTLMKMLVRDMGEG